MTSPQRGDFVFTRGQGVVGEVIRRVSRSDLAHCELLVERIREGVWWTHSAFGGGGPDGGGSGLRERIRDLSSEPVVLVRPWRTGLERELAILRSQQLVGSGYDWGEVVRAGGVLLDSETLQWAGDRLSSPERLICSNHCAEVLRAGRPDIALPYEPDRIWPDPLYKALISAPDVLHGAHISSCINAR